MLIITSIIGVILTGLLTLVILGMTSAWEGKASISLTVLAGLIGFTLCAVASIRGYYKDWYKLTVLLGCVLIAACSYQWFLGRDQWPGFCMIGAVSLFALDAFRNH